MGGMTIMEYAHGHPVDFAERVAGLLFISTTAEGTTHTRYGLPPRLAALMRAGETLGAGVLARSGPWRPHRAVLLALRPALRWLLFGDHYDDDALRVTMRGVGRASLRSIGGFRSSIGAQQRLDTLARLGDVPAAVLVGDRDRLTPPPCAESIAEALPGTGLTVFPGAGHMLLLERHAEVSAALVEITERAAESTPAERRRRARRARASRLRPGGLSPHPQPAPLQAGPADKPAAPTTPSARHPGTGWADQAAGSTIFGGCHAVVGRQTSSRSSCPAGAGRCPARPGRRPAR